MKSLIKCLCAIALPLSLLSCQKPTLSLAENIIDRLHPVDSIDHLNLDEILVSSAADDYLLFDTRSPEEFEISRIATAIQLDPDIDADDFLSSHGSRIRNKHLIFYCSVGYRSSTSIERLRGHARAAGALSLASLRGGIFRWYNEKHDVFDSQGKTDAIHPNASVWRLMLIERSKPAPAH